MARNVVVKEGSALFFAMTAGAEHEELPETLQRRRPFRSHETHGSVGPDTRPDSIRVTDYSRRSLTIVSVPGRARVKCG